TLAEAGGVVAIFHGQGSELQRVSWKLRSISSPAVGTSTTAQPPATLVSVSDHAPQPTMQVSAPPTPSSGHRSASQRELIHSELPGAVPVAIGCREIQYFVPPPEPVSEI